MSTRTNLQVVFVCLFAALYLTACGGKVELGLNLKPGDKRVIEVTNKLDTTVTVMGREQKETDDAVRRYTYEVETVDETGTATVKVTFNASDLAAGMQGKMFEQLGSGNPLYKIGEVALSMQLGRDGKVRSLTGMDEVADKIAAAMKDQLSETLKNLQTGAQPGATANMQSIIDQVPNMVRKTFGNDAIREQLQMFTNFYPQEPVGVRSTWSNDSTLTQPFPMKVAETYTVAARGAGLANIDFKGVISSSGGTMDMGPAQVTVNFSGEQKGTLQVEEATGWPKAVSTDVTMEGTVGAGGMSMPIKVSGNVYMKTYAL